MASQTAQLPAGVTLEYGLDGPPGAPVLCFVHGLGTSMQQSRPQAG